MKTQYAETKDAREVIIDWLRDAYGMERGLEKSLQKQSQNKDCSPSVRTRAGQHLAETQRHAEEVQAALHSLGADPSALKTGLGMTAQATKGLATMFAQDEQIKDLLDSYSMEHFEIACYTALAVAAEGAGLGHVAEMCRRIIPDEEHMAQSIIESLPREVFYYLQIPELAES